MTYDKLISLLNYNPDTGMFYWVAKRRGASKKKPAGTKTKSGYIQIMIDNKSYLAHRLAWLHETKSMPKNEIDHIDCNKLNNKIDNLRQVDAVYINQHNRKLPNKNNKAGLIGAFYSESLGKWFSRISVNNKKKWLGTFDNAIDAHNAYIKAKKQMHPANTLR